MCLEHPGDNRHEDFNLAHLRFHPTCALGGGLEQGSGTEEMLMCTLGFCYDLFVEENTPLPIVFELLDASEIQCDGHRVSLRDYEILVKGKTWYQRKFGATTSDPEDQKKMNAFLSKLASTPFDESDFNALRDKISQRLESPLKKKYIQIMQQSLAAKDNWQAMIRNIAAANGCSFFTADVVFYIKHTLGMESVIDFMIEMNKARADLYVLNFHLVHTC